MQLDTKSTEMKAALDAIMIQPTVGRQVWYRPNPDNDSICCHGTPLAATIAHVWNPRCVNLQVLDANGVAWPRASVLLLQGDELYRPVTNHCEWPPMHRPVATHVYPDGTRITGVPPFPPESPAKLPDLGGGTTEVTVDLGAHMVTALQDGQIATASTDLAAPAPRVTLEDIEANIAAEYSFRVDAALSECPVAPGVEHITICVLVLKNGIKIVGVNEGPVSAVNFDPELGRRYAREKAIDQIWPMMGYHLKQQLFEVVQ